MKRKIVVLVILVILMIFSFNTTNTYAGILDDVLSGGKDFVGSGSSGVSINQTQLKSTSKGINSAIMLISFVVVAVVGISLGIKFMMAGVEEKAEVKKSLITFVIGCGVIYGGYAIWRVILTFLNTL